MLYKIPMTSQRAAECGALMRRAPSQYYAHRHDGGLWLSSVQDDATILHMRIVADAPLHEYRSGAATFSCRQILVRADAADAKAAAPPVRDYDPSTAFAVTQLLECLAFPPSRRERIRRSCLHVSYMRPGYVESYAARRYPRTTAWLVPPVLRVVPPQTPWIMMRCAIGDDMILLGETHDVRIEIEPAHWLNCGSFRDRSDCDLSIRIRLLELQSRYGQPSVVRSAGYRTFKFANGKCVVCTSMESDL